jgi:hypothetical protein
MSRVPFACVASMNDRLSVAGSEDVVASVLAKHSPASILPGAWERGSDYAALLPLGGIWYEVRTEAGAVLAPCLKHGAALRLARSHNRRLNRA